MAEADSTKREEGESNNPSLEPPEPVLSATTAIREDQIQNAVAFLSHPKVSIEAKSADAHSQSYIMLSMS